MYEYEYRFLVLLIETMMILFSLFCVAAICHWFYSHFVEKRVIKRRLELSRYVLELLESESSPISVKSIKDLIIVLESFDRNFSDEHWKTLKESVAKRYILPKTRKWVYSASWETRSFAARSFALVPDLGDEGLILELLRDRRFVISSKAASAVVAIQSEKGVEKIIEISSQTRGFMLHYYRDLFAKAPLSVQKILIEKGKNSRYRETVLQLLSKHMLHLSIPFLEEGFVSEDREVKKAAIELCREGSSSLLPFLQDPDHTVRIQAIESLQAFVDKETAKDLLLSLERDEHWEVRLAAAKALKKVGEIDLLKNRGEMSRYVLEKEI